MSHRVTHTTKLLALYLLLKFTEKQWTTCEPNFPNTRLTFGRSFFVFIFGESLPNPVMVNYGRVIARQRARHLAAAEAYRELQKNERDNAARAGATATHAVDRAIPVEKSKFVAKTQRHSLRSNAKVSTSHVVTKRSKVNMS